MTTAHDLPRDPTDSTGRVTVVVGATSGIGLAAALELAGRGDRLVLAAREGAAFDAARESVTAAGATDVEAMPVDVGDRGDVARFVGEVLDRHGRIDAVVHTATVMSYGPLETVPADVFEAVVDTAIHGTMKLAREVLPVMRGRHRGTFVIVNSLLGAITVPNMGAYATAKWGQRAVARTLQQELLDEPDVHVCIASPGSINTPIYYQAANVLGRKARPPVPVLQPSVAGRVLADLLDKPRGHVTVRIGPANPVITFGYRYLPWLYDRLARRLFGLLALTRHTDEDDGNVPHPRPAQERVHGHWPDRPPA